MIHCFYSVIWYYLWRFIFLDRFLAIIIFPPNANDENHDYVIFHYDFDKHYIPSQKYAHRVHRPP